MPPPPPSPTSLFYIPSRSPSGASSSSTTNDSASTSSSSTYTNPNLAPLPEERSATHQSQEPRPGAISRAGSRARRGAFTGSRATVEAALESLPTVLKSHETYYWFGFDYTTSLAMWNLFHALRQPNDADDVFFDVVLRHINDPAIPDAATPMDDWEGTMVSLGIDRDLRVAMVQPEFDDSRFTQTCKYWLLDRMRPMWELLKMEFRRREEGGEYYDLAHMTDGTRDMIAQWSSPMGMFWSTRMRLFGEESRVDAPERPHTR